MSLKNTLTNEQLNARFDNSFALVNYAISLAKAKMGRGDELIHSNPANEALETIAVNKDHLDNIKEEGGQ